MNKLEWHRRNNKMTQEEVAEKVGVTRSTISLCEINNRLPSIKTCKKLVKLFKLNKIEDLEGEKR